MIFIPRLPKAFLRVRRTLHNAGCNIMQSIAGRRFAWHLQESMFSITKSFSLKRIPLYTSIPSRVARNFVDRLLLRIYYHSVKIQKYLSSYSTSKSKRRSRKDEHFINYAKYRRNLTQRFHFPSTLQYRLYLWHSRTNEIR